MTQTTARNEAAQLQERATNEARDVAQEVQHQAHQATQDFQQSLRDRTDEEAARFAQTLHDAGRQMNNMADAAGESSLAATVVREGGRAAERFASRIDDGGVQRVMADVRGWARRNPGGFLLGAAAAGFFVGRFARNMSHGNNATNTAAVPPEYAPLQEPLGGASNDAS